MASVRVGYKCIRQQVNSHIFLKKDQCQGHKHPSFTDACGERRLAHLVWSSRKAIVAHIAEKLDRRVSGHTEHFNLLCTGMCSHRSVRMPMMPPLKVPTMSMWASELDNGVMEEDCLIWWIMFSFRSGMRVCHLLGLAEAVICSMFCWETLGPNIPVDITLTNITYLKIVANYIYSFMAMVFVPWW